MSSNNDIKSDLKNALHDAIYDEYKDKNNPSKSIKGIDGIAHTLVIKAIDKNDKENLNAIKYIMSLLGIEKNDDINEEYMRSRINALTKK